MSDKLEKTKMKKSREKVQFDKTVSEMAERILQEQTKAKSVSSKTLSYIPHYDNHPIVHVFTSDIKSSLPDPIYYSSGHQKPYTEYRVTF